MVLESQRDSSCSTGQSGNVSCRAIHGYVTARQFKLPHANLPTSSLHPALTISSFTDRERRNAIEKIRTSSNVESLKRPSPYASRTDTQEWKKAPERYFRPSHPPAYDAFGPQ